METRKNSLIAAKALMSAPQGRELSCGQLLSWATAAAVACLLANWMVLSL